MSWLKEKTPNNTDIKDIIQSHHWIPQTYWCPNLDAAPTFVTPRHGMLVFLCFSVTMKSYHIHNSLFTENYFCLLDYKYLLKLSLADRHSEFSGKRAFQTTAWFEPYWLYNLPANYICKMGISPHSCRSHPITRVETLVPKVITLGKAFGRWINHEGSIPVSTKNRPKDTHLPHPQVRTLRRLYLWLRTYPSLVSALILTSQPLGCWEISSLSLSAFCFKSQNTRKAGP